MKTLDVVSLQMVRERGIEAPSAVHNSEDVVSLWRSLYPGGEPDREEVWLICCATNMRPVNVSMVSRGALDSAMLTPREILKTALLANARYMILVHNHPSGDPTPSQTDLQITEKIEAAGKMLGIELRDHVVVADGLFYSMRSWTALFAESR